MPETVIGYYTLVTTF